MDFNMNNKKSSFFYVVIASFVLLSSSVFSQLNLQNPANNATCIEKSPIFIWSNVSNIDHFTFYFSQSANFQVDSTITYNTGTDTTLKSINWEYQFQSQTKYYWKVVATLTNTQVINSNVFNFTTKTDPLQLYLPSNEETCLGKQIDFQIKTQYSHLDSLRFVIAKDSTFTQVVVDSTIFNPVIDTNSVAGLTLNVPSYATDYYWVAFQQVNGCWGDTVVGQSWKFTTKTGPTTLIYPPDVSKGIPLFQNGLPFVTNLSWQTINGALDYVIQVSPSDKFNTFTEYRSIDTTLQITLPNNYNTVYYWRVYAKTNPIYLVNDNLDSCNSEMSASRSIETPYEPVTLTFPADSSTCVPIVLNFTWNDVINAQLYRIQVATSDSFADSTIAIDIDSVSKANEIVTLPSGMTNFYWRVRVENPLNIGLWSASRYFQSTALTPNAVRPLTASTGVPKTTQIVWDKGIDNTTYELQVSSTFDMDSILLDTLINVNTFNYTFPDYNTKYYWRVKSYYNNCQSTWSDIFTMKTEIDSPTLTYPSNDSIGVEPVLVALRWQGAAGSEQYDVDLSTDSTFTNLTRWERDIYVTQVIFDNLSENTKYWWRVRGINSEGKSEWSNTFNFTTGYIRPSVPVLVSPSSGAYKLDVSQTLTWQESARALKYHLQFSDDVTFATTIIDEDTLTTTSFAVSNLKNNQTYYWRVAAINLGGQSDWSTIFSFKTIPLAPTATVQLISPQDGAKDLLLKTVEFTWNAIDSADVYDFIIAHDKNFTDVYYHNDKVWDTTKYMYNLEPKTTYYWKVRGSNDGGFSTWSNVWSFTTEDPASVQFTNYFNTQIVPSPVTYEARIQLTTESSGNLKLDVLDLTGKLVYSQIYPNLSAGNNELQLKTDNLQSGTYIYKISFDNKVEFGKFVVSK